MGEKKGCPCLSRTVPGIFTPKGEAQRALVECKDWLFMLSVQALELLVKYSQQFCRLVYSKFIQVMHKPYEIRQISHQVSLEHHFPMLMEVLRKTETGIAIWWMTFSVANSCIPSVMLSVKNAQLDLQFLMINLCCNTNVYFTYFSCPLHHAEFFLQT